MALFGQPRLDDFCRLRLAEAPLTEKINALLVGVGNDPLARRPDAVDEAHRRGVGKAAQRGCSLVGEARGGVLGVADRDLFEVLDAPEVAVLTNGAQIEAGDPKR